MKDLQKTIMFLYIFWLIAVVMSDCSINNGGCEQYCINRGSGSSDTCACGCHYELNGDMQTCDPSPKCNVDILYVVDASKATDTTCSYFGLPPLAHLINYIEWTIWKNTVGAYFQKFNDSLNSGEYEVAPMIVGLNTEFANYGDHGTSEALLSYLQAFPNSSVCGSKDVYEALYQSFQHDLVTSPTGPTGARDGATTSRVVFASVRLISDLMLNPTLKTHIDTIYEYYDQVFVIGKKDDKILSLLSLNPSEYEPEMRYLACRNESTSNMCQYLFFTDSANDFGDALNSINLDDYIDRSSCIKRKEVLTHSVECGSTEAVVSIPSCILNGLTREDLTLNDRTCNGSTFASLSVNNIIFTIGYENCNWNEQIESTANGDLVTFTQFIVTQDYGAGSFLFPVNLSVKCSFSRFSKEQLGFFNPVVDELNAEAMSNGTYSINVAVFSNSSFVEEYSGAFPYEVEVTSRLHIKATSVIPAPLFLVLQSITATNNSMGDGPIIYELMKDNCPVDESLVIYEDGADNIIQFSFNMFEFSDTANKQDAEKYSVYIHATFLICTDGDVSNVCIQGCTSRRKRNVPGQETSKTFKKTIGPFEITKNAAVQYETTMDGKNDERNNGLIGYTLIDYSVYFNSTRFAIVFYWFLVFLAVIFSFNSLSYVIFLRERILSMGIPKQAEFLHGGKSDSKQYNALSED